METFSSIFVISFYLLGVIWAPIYAGFWRKDWFLAALLVVLNLYLGFQWFGSFDELPSGESGSVIIGLIFIFPPYVTVLDIFAIFTFYTFLEGGRWIRVKARQRKDQREDKSIQ